MWLEVETAEKEKRRELVLHGKDIQARVQDSGIDPQIFKLDFLNFLEISEAGLNTLPSEVANLVNLTQLVLKGNCLASLPESVSSLVKLKLLDVSKNRLSSLPDLSGMDSLTTLNLSLNKFQNFPDVGIEKCTKLSTIDASVNDLVDISALEQAHLEHLAELNICRNELTSLSGDIKENWASLRKLNISDNKIKQFPAQLGELPKLKELSIINNPLQDNRLKKMAAQKSTKSVMEYIKQHGVQTEANTSSKQKKSGGKGSKGAAKEVDTLTDKLSVLAVSNDYPQIYVDLSVKELRPYIVMCFVKNIDISGENFRKFLQLQTKLHKTVCGNRTVATIATHDLANIKGPLRYTSKDPESLMIEPLDGGKPVSASKYVERLHKEAETMRKEKKRNQVSGIHQYLPMLDKMAQYPCLVDSEDRVISFPPVTNSAITRMSPETSELMVEVTSSTKMSDARMVADTFLREILELGLCSQSEESTQRVLQVRQGRVLDHEGGLKVTYPSKSDLVYEQVNFVIERT